MACSRTQQSWAADARRYKHFETPMKRKLLILTTLIIFTYPSFAAAEIPEYISEGFKAYEKSGPKEAIERWLEGSQSEGSQKLLANANILQQIEDLYGAYQGYDLFRSISIGPRSSIFLIIVYFENTPVYSRFVAYRKSSGKVVHRDIDFNTEIDEVWPPNLIYEQ